MAGRLEKAGFDALHVDAGCYESHYWSHPPMYQNHGCMVEMPAKAKRVVKIPVIGVGRLDIPELVDESCGILVAPHSAQELASAIDLLHRDRSLYRSLSEGAAQRAHQFSSDLWAARLLGWADSL